MKSIPATFVVIGGSGILGNYLLKELSGSLVYIVDYSAHIETKKNHIYVRQDQLLEYKNEIYAADVVINCLPLRRSRFQEQKQLLPKVITDILNILSSKKDLLWIQSESLQNIKPIRKRIPISAENCTTRNRPQIIHYEDWFEKLKPAFNVHCIYLAPIYSDTGENGSPYRIMDLLNKQALERLLLPLYLQNQITFLHVIDAVELIKKVLNGKHFFCSGNGNISRMIASEAEGFYTSELLSVISKEIEEEPLQPLPRIIAQASKQLLSGVHFLTSGSKEPHWIVPVQEFLENTNGIPAPDRTAQLLKWQPKFRFRDVLPIVCKLFKDKNADFILKNQILNAS